MSIPFAAIVTPDSVVFTDPTGKTHTVAGSHDQFDQIKGLVRELGKQPTRPDLLMADLLLLVTPAQAIIARSDGKVTVEDGVVYYGDMAVHSVLAERILWGLSEGFSMAPYIAFMENLMQNPSKRAVDQLFTFVEAHKMGITEDGHILAYKRVRDDFRDIHSGKYDNSPGQSPSMPRNMVNDDPDVTCSEGLHVCAQTYLPNFGVGEGNRIVICKVHPADVVSVPKDYQAAKMRACKYEVLGEYEGSDKDDLLASKAVFDSDAFRYLDSDDEDDEDDADYNSDEAFDAPEDDTSETDSDGATDFAVGDTVVCVNAFGLYDQMDISEGAYYEIKQIDEDSCEVCVEVTHAGFRSIQWYSQDRFRHVGYGISDNHDGSGSADRVGDPDASPVADVDASEFYGSAEYDRGYDHGFTKGLKDAEDQTIQIGEHSADGVDEYSNGLVAGWRDGMTQGRTVKAQETDAPIKIGAEPDVKPLAASPSLTVHPNWGLRFDPNTGGFRPV